MLLSSPAWKSWQITWYWQAHMVRGSMSGTSGSFLSPHFSSLGILVGDFDCPSDCPSALLLWHFHPVSTSSKEFCRRAMNLTSSNLLNKPFQSMHKEIPKTGWMSEALSGVVCRGLQKSLKLKPCTSIQLNEQAVTRLARFGGPNDRLCMVAATKSIYTIMLDEDGTLAGR